MNARKIGNLVTVVSLAGVICAALPTVSASRMNDCGQPATTGSISATDSLYVNNTAVNPTGYPCPLCVCDVNNSGTITASDALIILNEATNPGSQTLTCAAGSQSTCTPCNVTDVRGRLQGLANNARLTNYTSTIFRCTDQELTLTAVLATVTANNVIISAEDRGMTLRCTSNCTTDGVDFIRMQGANSTIKHFTVKDFHTGVFVTGDDNTIRNVSFIGSKNSGVETGTGSSGLEVRDSSFSDSAERGVYGNGTLDTSGTCVPSGVDVIYSATPGARSCYNLAVYDSTFSNVSIPASMTDAGRYLIKGVTMTGGTTWRNGSLLGRTSDDPTDPLTRFRVENTSVTGFTTGLRLFGYGSKHVLVNVDVADSTKRGVWGAGTCSAKVRTSDVLDNGGAVDSTYPYYGGIATGRYNQNDNPTVDAGTAGDAGNNLVCCNIDPNGNSRNFHQVHGTILQSGNLSCNGVTCN